MQTPADGPVRIDARLVGFLAAVVVVVSVVHHFAPNNFDFGIFYYAGHMIWDGSRTSLYDVQAQHIFQMRFGRPTEWLFLSPPFVLIPLLPVVLLPIGAAFTAWITLLLALFVFAIRSLCIEKGLRYGNWPILLSVTFMPVVACLAHGQFSIAALAAYIWCYALWRDGRRTAGGMALALVTVKYQLVAGFLCVLLLKGKWKELGGFAVGCIPLIILSDIIVGYHGLLLYPKLLLYAERTAGVDPRNMASLRGIVAWVFGVQNPVVIVALLSLAVIILAAVAWRDLDSGFSAALLASLLVSYHFSLQDLSLVLIPVFLAVKRMSLSALRTVVVASLTLPSILAVNDSFALLALPLIAMLVWVVGWHRGARFGLASGSQLHGKETS